MDYSISAHVGDLEAFVDLLELDQFVLVGMSLGGLNAMEYAGRHSQRLKGLVIVDIGPEIRSEGTNRIRDFLELPHELPSVDAFVERAMGFNSSRDPELLRVSLLHSLRQLPDGNWTWKYDRRHFGRFDPEEHRRSRLALAERLPAVTCPTLVVRGERSDVFSDEDAEKLVGMFPDARWVKIPGARHTVQGDNPRDLTKALREFLKEIGA
jgi:pimeloyl-ACP methyl ester carboxylesterase